MSSNHVNHKGYYVYSIITVIVFVGLFGFIGYLIYDVVIKLATNQFSNLTLIQSILTLIATVFLGGYFSKSLELKNNKKMETYKTQKEIAIKIIDLAGLIIRNEEKGRALNLLLNENYKVKLFFDDDLVLLINTFLENADKSTYIEIIDTLKKYFK